MVCPYLKNKGPAVRFCLSPRMYKKILSLIYVFKIIFFEKNNWLRKILLNKKSLQNFSSLDINEDFYYSFKNIRNIPFNGDRIRTDIVNKILISQLPKKIIETGTWVGNTTNFLSNFNSEVYSIESNSSFYALSLLRFSKKENVFIINGSSDDVINNFDNFKENIFVYLDAHWEEFVPLDYELNHLKNFNDVIVLIDDFKVEQTPGWKYDKYNDIELSLEYFPVLNSFDLFFPNYKPLDQDNHSGFVIASRGSKSKRILAEIKELTLLEKS